MRPRDGSAERLLASLRLEKGALDQARAAERSLEHALLGMRGVDIDAAAAQVQAAQDALFEQRDHRDQQLATLLGSHERRTAEQLLAQLDEPERPRLGAAIEALRLGWREWSQQRQRNLEHARRGRHLLKQLSGIDAPGTYRARGGRAQLGGTT